MQRISLLQGSRWWSVLCWCKRGFACALAATSRRCESLSNRSVSPRFKRKSLRYFDSIVNQADTQTLIWSNLYVWIHTGVWCLRLRFSDFGLWIVSLFHLARCLNPDFSIIEAGSGSDPIFRQILACCRSWNKLKHIFVHKDVDFDLLLLSCSLNRKWKTSDCPCVHSWLWGLFSVEPNVLT